MKTRASMWWVPGWPLAVGGPSKKFQRGPFRVARQLFSKVPSASQKAMIPWSIAGRSIWAGTAR